MMKQVHVVGVSPRTGTTLMAELMSHCFDFDGYADHELSFYFQPVERVQKLCTKKPSDLWLAHRALKWRNNLWIICMVRDPRDVVVSRHSKRPDLYWSNLGIIHRRMPYLMKARRQSRFMIVRYEDLVSDPDQVQGVLQSKMAFLTKTADFSRFHEVVKPTRGAVEALSGVRPISTSSIGRWHSELPRLKAQIDRFGRIDSLIRELGYEHDDAWLSELDSVIADNGKGYFEDNPAPMIRNRVRDAREYWLLCRQRLGWPVQKNVITRDTRVV